MLAVRSHTLPHLLPVTQQVFSPTRTLATALALLAVSVGPPAIGIAGAQTLTTNADGERIVVYPDGSWRYFSDPPPPAPEADPAEMPVDEEVYTQPALSAEAEARARAIVRQRIEVQQRNASKMRRTVDRARRDEARARERFTRLQAGNAGRAEVREATEELQEAERDLAFVSNKLQRLERETQLLERTIPMTRAQRTDFLLEAGLADSPPGQPSPDDPAQATPPESPTTSTPSERADPVVYRAYDRNADPALNPPTRECVYASDGVDEFSKKRRRELATETFFAYTSTDLRRTLGQDDLITARGRLVDNGGEVTFAVTYVIRSAFANREFGALPRGAGLALRLVGGGEVLLRNARLVQGEYDPVDKVTRYEARYPLDKSAIKTLSRRYLDDARVTWGTGFEDYPLYDIDYFRRLLACL